MMNLAEYRHRTQSLADFLPWAALVEKGVILNKDGSFQRTARFRGPDLDSATPAELVAITSRLNNALRRLGSGWAVFIEAQRVPAHRYPVGQFPDSTSDLVDAERRAQFEEEGAHFESRYFLTLLWLPPADDAARAESWLYEGRSHAGADWRAVLEGFIDRTDRVLALIEGFMPEADWLDDGETLTYLHSCISTRRQRVRVPETPMYLDAILVDEDLTGGLEPRLGRAHLRTLTIMGFPSQTWPGLLDDLNRLAFPYRWATRAVCLDKTDATRLLGKIRRQWFAKRKSIMAILKEVMTNEASVLMDSDAANKALDADAALQELGTDLVGEAYVTATVTVWNEDPRIADERLRLVEKAIQGRDFTCMREGVNAIEAWLGSLPGHVYANVRQPPVSTLNLAHMMPFSAVWAGPERDEHFQAPPLFFARTEGSTPFRFSLHVGDVGHTLIVGPTGAGKSVLLALMALQFRRYAGAQVFAFDFGGSIRAAALAMGGDWHDLGGALADNASAPVALQPLARVDDAGERAWAAEWVATLLARESVTVTPELKEHLWSALTSLASAPVLERTITGLSVLLQSNALKQALQPYTVSGPWGRLLDAESGASRRSRGAGLRDRGPDRRGRGARRTVLSVSPHRRSVRRPADHAHRRRGVARARRSRLRRPAPRVAEDAAEEERLGDLRYPVARRHRRQRHRAGDHRKLPNPDSFAKRTRARAADRGDLSALRSQRSADRDPEPGDAEARILLSVAPRQSRVRARPLRSRARLHGRLVEDRPDRHRRDPRRPRSRWLRRRMAAPQGPRLGGRHAHPQRRGFIMITRRLRAGLIAGVAALSIAAFSVPAHAQWIVFDPTNFGQNILTAARELQQVNNEIRMLENQATSLINQARNLASLPYSSLAQLQQQITQTQQLLAQAQRIAYSVTTIDQAFTQTYPQAYSGSTSSQQLLADAQTRWQNALASFQDTMRVQAGVVTNLNNTRTQINALVSSSQSATGALQAAQSGNQLVALQTTQLADLTALMASIARAQSLDAARTLETQAQAQAQTNNFLNYGSGYQPGSAQMFH